MRRPARLAVFVLVVSAFAASQNASRPSLNPAIDVLFAVHTLLQTEISPDGKHVAWVESLGQGNSAIRVVDLDQPSIEPTRITAAADGDCAEAHITWSPNSRQDSGSFI